MDHCEECGFIYDSVGRSDVPGRIRGLGPRYRNTVSARTDVRRRPAPDVWSPLEYACHVRDVLRVQRERMALAQQVDQPDFAPMGRDRLAADDRYNEQDPDTVLAQLAAEAEATADAVAALEPAGWLRTGRFPWPRPELRTVEWVARHTVHEGEHHLLDIARQAPVN